jgi:hypothetical protein
MFHRLIKRTADARGFVLKIKPQRAFLVSIFESLVLIRVHPRLSVVLIFFLLKSPL